MGWSESVLKHSVFHQRLTCALVIGVGKAFGLPSLRTVRAVLPHTALQSLVSSSGAARLCKGCFEGEQSVPGEEGVGPLLMVGSASSDSGPLVLFSRDGAQPSSNEAVYGWEQGRRGVFEAAKPSPQYGVEVRDDPLEAVASAAHRLTP